MKISTERTETIRATVEPNTPAQVDLMVSIGSQIDGVMLSISTNSSGISMNIDRESMKDLLAWLNCRFPRAGEDLR